MITKDESISRLARDIVEEDELHGLSPTQMEEKIATAIEYYARVLYPEKIHAMWRHRIKVKLVKIKEEADQLTKDEQEVDDYIDENITPLIGESISPELRQELWDWLRYQNDYWLGEIESMADELYA